MNESLRSGLVKMFDTPVVFVTNKTVIGTCKKKKKKKKKERMNVERRVVFFFFFRTGKSAVWNIDKITQNWIGI